MAFMLSTLVLTLHQMSMRTIYGSGYNSNPLDAPHDELWNEQEREMRRELIEASGSGRVPSGRSFVSPNNGTDISQPIQLAKCNNQTRCVSPFLELQPTFSVYYCKHTGHGVRFYYLVREGLLLHPNINLVDAPDIADVIVYLPTSSPWHKTECSKPEYMTKTVVLDEGDGPELFQVHGNKDKWLLYFKRSYVRRHDGKFQSYMPYLKRNDVLPMTYTTVEAYIKTEFAFLKDRDLDIVSTLRGSKQDPTRLRIREWVEEYCKARGLNCVVGQVNHASRTVVDKDYLKNMYRAKMIVTVNPSGWEGDFRLMEAMATGSMVLVDKMYVPRPHPLLHDQHIVYYDNNNKTDIFDKLDFYHKHVEHSRRVAVSGYLHVLKYHRAANLMDYVFRTIHLKLLKHQSKEAKHSMGVAKVPPISPKYTFTGYHMRNLCKEYAAHHKG